MRPGALFVGAALAVASTTAVGEEDKHWTLGVDDSGYESAATLSQVSVDTIPDEYASKEVQPEMQFRCAGGEITFRIDWQRFISSFGTEAGFRVDGGDALWIKLSVDSSNRMTIAKAGDAATLIERMSTGDVLNVEIAPYSEPSVFVNFDTSTITEALRSLEKECG